MYTMDIKFSLEARGVSGEIPKGGKNEE